MNTEYNKPPKINRRKYRNVNSMLFYKNLPFVGIIFFLGLIYAANVHYAEKHLQRSQVLQEEIKELKWQYWSLKSGIMYQSMEGQLSKRVQDKEIYIREQAPKKIVRVEQ